MEAWIQPENLIDPEIPKRSEERKGPMTSTGPFPWEILVVPAVSQSRQWAALFPIDCCVS
jgi:hypothetical protein